jgi:hypothetical protein
VARLVMDKETTKRSGGFVTIDHYVQSPQKLASDVREIATETDGRVILGEFGVPIPGVHDGMSEAQQAAWMQSALDLLVDVPALAGINYWTSFGKSSALWAPNGRGMQGAAVLKSYYVPKALRGKITDRAGKPIALASVQSPGKRAGTDASGSFVLPYVKRAGEIRVSATGFDDRTVAFKDVGGDNLEVSLDRQEFGLFASARKTWEAIVARLRMALADALRTLAPSE